MDGFLSGQHKFLPFVANGINWCPTQGQDVISAHFSGCIMAVYQDGGANKVCHISTGADFGDCKGAWQAIKARSKNVFEFRPSDFIEDTPHSKCYGLITADLQMFTVLVGSQRVNLDAEGSKKALPDEKFIKIIKAHPLRE